MMPDPGSCPSPPDVVVEHTFEMDIRHPTTNELIPGFVLRGKVDLLNYLNGVLSDWKTTADVAAYIAQKTMSFQLEFYALGMQALGHEVSKVEYRLITRPKHKLNQRLDKMDDKAFEDRVFENLQQPGKLDVLEFFPTPARLQAARERIYAACMRIKANRESGFWLTNSDACYQYHKPCPYLPLCQAQMNGADVEWLAGDLFVIGDPHPELGEDAQVKETQSQTSINLLTLCEARAFWRYERRLQEPERESEPLFVGNVVHAGMEAYAADGLEAGLNAATEWAAENVGFGDDIEQRSNTAKARAMVRAAAEKWPS